MKRPVTVLISVISAGLISIAGGGIAHAATIRVLSSASSAGVTPDTGHWQYYGAYTSPTECDAVAAQLTQQGKLAECVLVHSGGYGIWVVYVWVV
jgi:hypothetical protein